MRSFGRRKVKEGGNKLGKLFPPCLERTPNFVRNCGAKKRCCKCFVVAKQPNNNMVISPRARLKYRVPEKILRSKIFLGRGATVL